MIDPLCLILNTFTDKVNIERTQKVLSFRATEIKEQRKTLEIKTNKTFGRIKKTFLVSQLEKKAYVSIDKIEMKKLQITYQQMFLPIIHKKTPDTIVSRV